MSERNPKEPRTEGGSITPALPETCSKMPYPSGVSEQKGIRPVRKRIRGLSQHGRPGANGAFIQSPAEARVSYETIAAHVLYNADTGDLIRLTGRNRGKAVKSMGNDGYLRIFLEGRYFQSHRVAWLLAYGEWPKSRLDHRDGNPINNALSNLRLATQSDNNANARPPSRNTSGFKGVIAVPGGKYTARIKRNGKVKHLGTFLTKSLAAEAYALAAREIFGEFARAGE